MTRCFGEWTFDTNQSYAQMADGSMLANAGDWELPGEWFSATGAGAPGIGSISQSATGGSLPANVMLRVAICAVDSNGLPSAPSNIAIIGRHCGGRLVHVGEHHLAGGRGLVSYVLFVATQDDLICAQATGALTAGRITRTRRDRSRSAGRWCARLGIAVAIRQQGSAESQA